VSIIVYRYTGSKEVTYPGSGKWLRLKTGDQIVVVKHSPCKHCKKCLGMAMVAEPPMGEICLDIFHTDKVPFEKVSEINTNKVQPKSDHRRIDMG
jgi:hypothetical protein